MKVQSRFSVQGSKKKAQSIFQAPAQKHGIVIEAFEPQHNSFGTS
jgi:hypothetical protein